MRTGSVNVKSLGSDVAGGASPEYRTRHSLGGLRGEKYFLISNLSRSSGSGAKPWSLVRTFVVPRAPLTETPLIVKDSIGTEPVNSTSNTIPWNAWSSLSIVSRAKFPEET